jgi:hypothetical protein
VDRQSNLLEIVFALGAAGRLAGLLHRGQQQRHQNANDRDHHQQFNQREPTLATQHDRLHQRPPGTQQNQNRKLAGEDQEKQTNQTHWGASSHAGRAGIAISTTMCRSLAKRDGTYGRKSKVGTKTSHPCAASKP